MGDYESRFFGLIDIIMKNDEKLRLSDEQMTEIKDLKATAKAKVTPMNEKMSALDVEINTLSWEEFDLDSINKLVAEKHQIMHQKSQYLTSMHNTLLCKILSPEQRDILKAMPGANQGVVDPGQDDLTCEEPEL
jgi:predicted enzyme involved in methoxymalonyl-ACP biosynthesis